MQKVPTPHQNLKSACKSMRAGLNQLPLNGRVYFDTILRITPAAHMLACRNASQISVNQAMATIPNLCEVFAMCAHTDSHHWRHRCISPTSPEG